MGAHRPPDAGSIFAKRCGGFVLDVNRAGPRKRALFLAPEAPYPLIGGGALRAGSLIKYLAQHYTVDADAILFHEPGTSVDLPSGLVDRLKTFELPLHSKQYAPRALRNGRRLLRGELHR